MSTERLIADLAIIFVAAKVAAVAFERLKLSAVVGELLVGIVLGPHVLEVIGHSHTHEVFQELGAIILLFAVGLDTPLSELRAVGSRSLAVAVTGVAVPFIAGFGLMMATGYEMDVALFVATAMVATSVGVTARVLSDLGRIRDEESRVILGAAVIDDVLGLLVLAFVTQSAADDFSPGALVVLGILALGFVVLVGGIGAKVVARAEPSLGRLGNRGVFIVALAVCLALSAAAGALDLAAIVGAFLAGMAFAETRERYDLEQRIDGIYTLLVPFFFVVTGSVVDPAILWDVDTASIGMAVLVVAIAAKFVGCGIAAGGMGRRSATVIGIGMVPRGEVGILVASIGLSRGIVGPNMYAVVVAMSVITTVIVPPALAAIFGAGPGTRRRRRSPEIEGIGG